MKRVKSKGVKPRRATNTNIRKIESLVQIGLHGEGYENFW